MTGGVRRHRRFQDFCKEGAWRGLLDSDVASVV